MSMHRTHRLAGTIAIALSLIATLNGIALPQEKLWTVYGQPPSSPCATFGEDVASGGDVNGDGVWDVIVGNQCYDTGGATGAAWVFSGKDGTLIHLVESFQGNGFGECVAILSDIDGDGLAEFLIGDSGDNTGSLAGGAVYAYSGADATLKWSLFGISSDHLGREAALIADYDSDGLRDVGIGADGSSTTGLLPYVRVVSSLSGTEIMTLYSPSSSPCVFGRAIADAQDVNGDGVWDVVVGDWCDYAANVSGTGAAFVFSGADWSVIHEIYEQQAEARFGDAVAGVGDVNGDGHDDFIVGAPWYDTLAEDGVGKAVVYSGLDASVLYSYTGHDVFYGNTGLGDAVAGAGDVNGDGFPDFYIGEPSFTMDCPSDCGATWLYSGRNGAMLYHFEGDTSLPPGTTSLFGKACTSAGDVNADGRPDVLVGAPGDPTNGFQAGSAAMFTGNDWYLDASSRLPFPYLTVTLTMGQTNPGQLAALFLTEVNGTPTSALLLVGACDSTGRLLVSDTVPPGLSGLSIGLLSFGIGFNGKIVASASERIEFQ